MAGVGNVEPGALAYDGHTNSVMKIPDIVGLTGPIARTGPTAPDLISGKIPATPSVGHLIYTANLYRRFRRIDN